MIAAGIVEETRFDSRTNSNNLPRAPAVLKSCSIAAMKSARISSRRLAQLTASLTSAEPAPAASRAAPTPAPAFTQARSKAARASSEALLAELRLTAEVGRE